MSIAKSIKGENESDDSPSTPEPEKDSVIENDSTPPIGDLFSALSSGLDPKMLQMIITGMQEFGKADDDKVHTLLHALHPFLKDTRKAKLEQAMQIAKLSRIARVVIKGMDGGDDHV